MKIQRDRLHQYQRRITVLTDRETDIARQMLAKGDKKRALLALRRKKYQQTLLAQTDAQLEQLEKLTSNVEFAQIQKDVVFGLQQGTRVLSEIHAEMGGIDHVEKLMGETADAIAYQKVRPPPPPFPGTPRCPRRVLMPRETGGQRDAGRPHLQPGRGGGRGRAGRAAGRVVRTGTGAAVGPERAAARVREGSRAAAGEDETSGGAGHAGGVMASVDAHSLVERHLWRYVDTGGKRNSEALIHWRFRILPLFLNTRSLLWT